MQFGWLKPYQDLGGLGSFSRGTRCMRAEARQRGWIWMVLWILMLFSIFYCTAGKLKQCRNLRGPFTLSLDCDGSVVITVVVDRYIVSFDMTGRCCFWKMVLCWFGLLGRLVWSKLICCFNASGINESTARVGRFGSAERGQSARSARGESTDDSAAKPETQGRFDLACLRCWKVQYSRRSAVGSESLGDHAYLTDVSTASVGIHECKKFGVSSCITCAARSCRYCKSKWLRLAWQRSRTPGTDGLFFAWGFLRGVRADKTLDALSSRSASLRPGKPSNSPLEVAFTCPFVVLDPTDLGATIVVAPGKMPGNFLPSPDADCLPFGVKLVRV